MEQSKIEQELSRLFEEQKEDLKAKLEELLASRMHQLKHEAANNPLRVSKAKMQHTASIWAD